MACRKEKRKFTSHSQSRGQAITLIVAQDHLSNHLYPSSIQSYKTDEVMGESSAAGYTTADHLWFRKLQEKCHIMLAFFLCLWSHLMVGYPIMVHMFILQLEIMFTLNLQMSDCIFPFGLTEKIFCSGFFSISIYSQVRWYLSFWSLIDSPRGKSCPFVLFTASGPCGTLRLALWGSRAR